MSDDFIVSIGKSLVGTGNGYTVTGEQLTSISGDIEKCKEYVLTNYRKFNNDPSKKHAVGFSVSKDENGNALCYIDDGNGEHPLFKDENSDYYLPLRHPANEYKRLVIRGASFVDKTFGYSNPTGEALTFFSDILPQAIVKGRINSICVTSANNGDMVSPFIVSRCNKETGVCVDTKEEDYVDALLYNFIINPQLHKPGGPLGCKPEDDLYENGNLITVCDKERRYKRLSTTNEVMKVVRNGESNYMCIKDFVADKYPLNILIQKDKYKDLYIPYFTRNEEENSLGEEVFRMFNTISWIQDYNQTEENKKNTDSNYIPRRRHIPYEMYTGKRLIMPDNNHKYIVEGNSSMALRFVTVVTNVKAVYISSDGTNYLYTAENFQLVDGVPDDPNTEVVEGKEISKPIPHDVVVINIPYPPFTPSCTIERYGGESATMNFDNSLYNEFQELTSYNEKEDSDNSTSNKWIIIASIVAGIIILGIIGYIIYRKRKN